MVNSDSSGINEQDLVNNAENSEVFLFVALKLLSYF